MITIPTACHTAGTEGVKQLNANKAPNTSLLIVEHC
jgi:hypothetical protein